MADEGYDNYTETLQDFKELKLRMLNATIH